MALDPSDVVGYLAAVDAVDAARRMVRAYDAGRQPLGAVAWALGEIGRQVERAAEESPSWLDELAV